MAHGKRISSSTPLTSNTVDSDNLEDVMDWELSGINGSIALVGEDPVFYSEELFNTPESESENSESESENDENPEDEEGIDQAHENESLEAPTYSQITETEFNDNSPTVVNWTWTPDTSSASLDPLEFVENPRWGNLIQHNDNLELNYFLQFFTPEVLEFVAKQSNEYFLRVKGASDNPSRRMNNFKEISSDDVLRLIAVRICMGLDKKPKQSDYWSGSPFYSSRIVPTIMTSDRYKEILKYLHFCDNSNQQQGDRLYKLQEIWAMVTGNMQAMYSPGKDICIDESLILYKGKLHFKQYIPNKSSKFGVKIFSIADSLNGYILNSIIYKGAGHEFMFSKKDYGFGGSVALELVNPYVGKGRCLFIDNYFTNAKMAKQLLSTQTNVCGTLRKNLKENPKMKDVIRKGEVMLYSSNGIMVERWRDKKEVRMISTGFPHAMFDITTKSGAEKRKPHTVLIYNKKARAIDKSDMVIGANDLLRKTTKWYKKIVFHLVDVCIYNASVMYAANHPKIPLLKFKENMVQQIITTCGVHATKRGRKPTYHGLTRLQDRHFPVCVPATANNMAPCRDCVVCKKRKNPLPAQINRKVKKSPNRTKTRYMCFECDVGLCPSPCFKIFHTVNAY